MMYEHFEPKHSHARPTGTARQWVNPFLGEISVFSTMSVKLVICKISNPHSVHSLGMLHHVCWVGAEENLEIVLEVNLENLD